MVRPTILVTGAAGKTGSAVVSQLRQRGWPVRAIVRNVDARSERLRAEGANVVVANLFDPQQLLEAMRGASCAYYCPPWHPYMIQSAAAFAVAARQARLEAVVGLSQWVASPAHPSLATRQNWLADQIFSMLPGVAHVIVNPGFFADNYFRLIGFAAQLGIFPMPTGASRNAPPSNEDVARVAVAALIEPERHAGKSYRPTGPTLLDAAEMAAILQRVLGRRVRHVDMPMGMFLKAARTLGISAFEQSGVRRYIEEHKRGAFEFGAPTNDVYEVAGQPPEDFETIARRYAALPEARRTLANKVGAIGQFIRIGFTPAYDLDRFEREQQHPLVADPQFVLDSQSWRREHRLAPFSISAPLKLAVQA